MTYSCLLYTSIEKIASMANLSVDLIREWEKAAV